MTWDRAIHLSIIFGVVAPWAALVTCTWLARRFRPRGPFTVTYHFRFDPSAFSGGGILPRGVRLDRVTIDSPPGRWRRFRTRLRTSLRAAGRRLWLIRSRAAECLMGILIGQLCYLMLTAYAYLWILSDPDLLR